MQARIGARVAAVPAGLRRPHPLEAEAESPLMGADTLTYGRNGLAMTKQFEGDVLRVYQNEVGVLTISYSAYAGGRPAAAD